MQLEQLHQQLKPGPDPLEDPVQSQQRHQHQPEGGGEVGDGGVLGEGSLFLEEAQSLVQPGLKPPRQEHRQQQDHPVSPQGEAAKQPLTLWIHIRLST
jgi:hypothetical protein